jgi:copper(I)-binding protein
MKLFIPLAALLLASCSNGTGVPDVMVSDAWARESRGGPAAAYMTIENRGSGDDRLVSVAAAPPAMAMLHVSTSEGGVSRMREAGGGLEIPAHAKVELKPGGAHVMLMGLPGSLEKGSSLKLTLRFERSGERPVDVRVVGATER